jgi:hypothetical protein
MLIYYVCKDDSSTVLNFVLLCTLYKLLSCAHYNAAVMSVGSVIPLQEVHEIS